jgi:biotin carboxylase
VQGIATNLELHAALLAQPEFARGVDTAFLPHNLERLLPATAA